jgi:hypothetical protein
MKTGRIAWFDGLEGLVVDETGTPFYMYRTALPESGLDPESLTNRKIKFSIYSYAATIQVDQVEFIPEEIKMEERLPTIKKSLIKSLHSDLTNLYNWTREAKELLTSDDYLEAVRLAPESNFPVEWIGSVPDHLITPMLMQVSLWKDPYSFPYFPRLMQTKPIAWAACHEVATNLRYVHSSILDEDICYAAITVNPQVLPLVPERFRTRFLLTQAVILSPMLITSLEKEEITEEMIAKALLNPSLDSLKREEIVKALMSKGVE